MLDDISYFALFSSCTSKKSKNNYSIKFNKLKGMLWFELAKAHGGP